VVSSISALRVSQLLGHAPYTVTLDTYGDWIEQDDSAPAPLPAPPAPTTASAHDGAVVPLRARTTG
jgi:hypothetical protein